MRNAGVHLVEAVVDLLNFAAPLVRQADGKIAVFRPAHFLRESCDRLYDDAVGQKDGQRDEQDCVEHIPDEQLLKAAGSPEHTTATPNSGGEGGDGGEDD